MNFINALNSEKKGETENETHSKPEETRSNHKQERQRSNHSRQECYRNRFITHEDTGFGPPMEQKKWCKEYSAEIDFHFRTLIKSIKKHFPKKKINIVKAYKNFKNLCYESSSIKDDFDFIA
jgi:hypothetical protein